MATVTERLMTADEFYELCRDGRPRELVRGEVVDLMPPSYDHGRTAGRINQRLQNWIDDRGADDDCGVEAGFVVEEGPDTVRGPDVFYVRAENRPPAEQRRRFVRMSPDLAVEVVSPSNTARELRDKTAEYFAAGTSMVWLVFPERREIFVHTPDGHIRMFGPDATLEGLALLPGFSHPVTDMFPRPRRPRRPPPGGGSP